MHSTPTTKANDDPHDVVAVAPDAVRVAPSDDEISSLLHQAARYRLETPARAAPELPAAPPIPAVDTTFRASAVNNVPGRRSLGGRPMRTLAALLLAACIGGAAIAWQSYGDMAKAMIAMWAPQLVMTSSLPAEKPALAAEPAPPADVADATASQPAALAQAAPQAAPAAVSSPDSAQMLQSMTRDLASVRQEVEQLKASIEQLKANQQQMSRDAVKASDSKASETKASDNRASDTKTSEPNPRPRVSALPPRPVARVRRPAPPPYYPPPQAAAAPLPQAAAPYVPRQVEPQPQAIDQPPADPELPMVPRPPMPLR
jgi:flagellar motor protein MotB